MLCFRPYFVRTALVASLAFCLCCNRQPPPDLKEPEADPPPEPELSWNIPKEVGGHTKDHYDRFAWAAFVALNWPAEKNGPLQDKTIGTSPESPRVWEFFTNPANIFSADCSKGEPPTPDGSKLLAKKSKRIGLSGEDNVQASPAWPLIDAKNNYTLYEIRLDRDHLTPYIVGRLDCPEHFREFKESGQTVVIPSGSIEIKAAWRILPEGTPAEALGRYYHRSAAIELPPEEGGGSDVHMRVTVGLVGLHINIKLRDQPGSWVWATFEQVDNYEVGRAAPDWLKPSYNGGPNPSKVNRQPMNADGTEPDAYAWTNGPQTAAGYQTTNVQLTPNEIPLPKQANQAWQQLLAQVEGSPWQYYRLNVAQWLDKAGSLKPVNDFGAPISRNSVLETYMLGDQFLATELPTDPLPPSYPTETLNNFITAQLAVEKDLVLTEYTWSSCGSCHQLGLYQYGETEKDFILTDYSMVFRAYLPEM